VRRRQKTNTPFFEFTEDHFSFNCAVVYRIQKVNKTVFQCSVGHSLDLQGDSNEHDGKRVFNRSTVRRKRNMHSVSWLCSFHFGRRRTIEDGSFQRAFQTAYKEGKFSMKWLQLRIISKRSKLLESGIPEMAFRREPFYRMRRFDLRNGEEEEMGYEVTILSRWFVPARSIHTARRFGENSFRPEERKKFSQ
jgi:hypothetical protein